MHAISRLGQWVLAKTVKNVGTKGIKDDALSPYYGDRRSALECLCTATFFSERKRV